MSCELLTFNSALPNSVAPTGHDVLISSVCAGHLPPASPGLPSTFVPSAPCRPTCAGCAPAPPGLWCRLDRSSQWEAPAGGGRRVQNEAVVLVPQLSLPCLSWLCPSDKGWGSCWVVPSWSPLFRFQQCWPPQVWGQLPRLLLWEVCTPLHTFANSRFDSFLRFPI